MLTENVVNIQYYLTNSKGPHMHVCIFLFISELITACSTGTSYLPRMAICSWMRGIGASVLAKNLPGESPRASGSHRAPPVSGRGGSHLYWTTMEWLARLHQTAKLFKMTQWHSPFYSSVIIFRYFQNELYQVLFENTSLCWNIFNLNRQDADQLLAASPSHYKL